MRYNPLRAGCVPGPIALQPFHMPGAMLAPNAVAGGT
jgi:hypothetical protein